MVLLHIANAPGFSLMMVISFRWVEHGGLFKNVPEAAKGRQISKFALLKFCG